MQIGGTLVNGVVRIAILAATLALVYFLILKPILATTENITESTNSNVQRAFESVNDAFDGTPQAGTRTEIRIKSKIKGGSGVDHQRLLKCVQKANGNINRIQRCANRFTR